MKQADTKEKCSHNKKKKKKRKAGKKKETGNKLKQVTKRNTGRQK